MELMWSDGKFEKLAKSKKSQRPKAFRGPTLVAHNRDWRATNYPRRSWLQGGGPQAQRAWVTDQSVVLKSSLNTISESATVKAELMELLMPCHASWRTSGLNLSGINFSNPLPSIALSGLYSLTDAETSLLTKPAFSDPRPILSTALTPFP